VVFFKYKDFGIQYPGIIIYINLNLNRHWEDRILWIARQSDELVAIDEDSQGSREVYWVLESRGDLTVLNIYVLIRFNSY